MRFFVFYGLLLLVIFISVVVIRKTSSVLFPKHKSAIRLAAALAGVAFFVSNVATALGMQFHREWVRYLFLPAVVTFVSLIGTAFVMLVMSFFFRQKDTPQATNSGRRNFLKAILPASAATVGPVGTAFAHMRPQLREVEFTIPGLDPRLDGLKVAQLTDIHLGMFISLDQVRHAIELVRPFSPDLVVYTGDIADDLTQLGDALRLGAELNPSVGTYVCIGNHEIYRGREVAEQVYAESPATYLCNDGVVAQYQGASIYICGSDDPAKLGQNHDVFYNKSIDEAVAKRPTDADCSILLCHRPAGFVRAAENGITLTLAGHTHGGQLALFGRSVFEWLVPDAFLLGKYKRNGNSFLYTSAGLGHWFPFRLGCPCEVALITLKSGIVS